MANPDEAFGQDMQEEASHELRSQECHLSLLAAVRVILPPECYALAVKGQEPVVGNGHPMRVPAQVTEDLLRAAKRQLAFRPRLTAGAGGPTRRISTTHVFRQFATERP